MYWSHSLLLLRLMSGYRGGFLRWAAAVLFLYPLAALGEFRQTSVPWQQTSAPFEVVLGLERDVFESSDRSGRFVIALQTGKEGKPAEFECHWRVLKAGEPVAAGKGTLESGMLVVDFDLDILSPASYEVIAEILRNGKKVAEEKRGFALRDDSGSGVSKAGRVPLRFPSGVPPTAKGYPLTFGVPFPKGALPDVAKLRVVDAKGKAIPAQFTARSHWSADGRAGIRWLGVDLQVPEITPWWPDRTGTPLFLEYGRKVAPKPPESLRVEQVADGIRVETGVLGFLVRSDGFNLLDDVSLNGVQVLNQGRAGGAYVVDHEGAVYRAANDRAPRVSIEESGPLRAVIRVEGWYVKDGTAGTVRNFRLPTEALCKFTTRIEAYAGLPWVRILHTWINTSDSYSVFFKDVGFSLMRPGNVSAEFGVEGGQPVRAEVESGVYLLQHLADRFEVCRLDGYVLVEGGKSDGTVQVSAADAETISLANRDTWQRFPKEMEVLPQEVRFHMWPAHGKSHPEIDPFAKDRYHQLWFAHQGQLLDLRFPWETLFAVMRFTDNPSTGIYKPGGTAMGGVQSSAMGIAVTTDFMVHFSDTVGSEAARRDLAAFEQRPTAVADAQWISDSGVMGPVHPYDPENFRKFEEAAQNAILGLSKLQDQTGQYGMFLYRGWHHGKYLGDGYWDPYRLYSAGHHYDPYIPWLYFARSGDPRYGELGLAGMRHLTDLGICHYADPAYEHREFYSEQQKLVGATGHTNGFVLWGGDHAILSHQTSYGAIMLAYYLTGDPRFREVVVGEWQHTLLDDRLNPGWKKASRMNWGKKVSPDINRDNNQALGEMLDLYQLTYDPRILALIQPCVQSMEQNMYPWSRELQNVLAFRRTPKLKAQLVEAAKKRRSDRSSSLYHAFKAVDGGRYALAAMVDPRKGFERDALWATRRLELVRAPKDAWTWDRPSPEAYKVPDNFLEMPMVMEVSKSLVKPGWEEEILPPQKLPISSEHGGTESTKMLVKEEMDEEFVLNFQGRIASSGARVRVIGPDGVQVANEALPAGEQFELKVPKDGVAGEYIVLVNLQAELDSIALPVSSLEKEVYVSAYWIQSDPQCFFVGTPNADNGLLELAPGKNGFALEKRGDFSLLGERTPGDFETPFVCKLPSEGAWFVSSGYGRYFSTPKGKPVVLALNPARFFVPSPPILGAAAK